MQILKGDAGQLVDHLLHRPFVVLRSPLPSVPTGGGYLQHHAASVRRIGAPLDKARRFQPIQQRRHRAGGDVELLGQVFRCPGVVRVDQVERSQISGPDLQLPSNAGPHPFRRAARIAKYLAIPVALIVSGLVVAQASYSTYSDSTVNPTNNWTSGTVKLYGTTPATTLALSTYLNLTVTQGTAGTFASCTGFTPLATGASVYSGTLLNFSATATNFASGLGSWAPTGTAPETRTYQFVYTLSATAPDTTQGGTAAIGFTWEVQNS